MLSGLSRNGPLQVSLSQTLPHHVLSDAKYQWILPVLLGGEQRTPTSMLWSHDLLTTWFFQPPCSHSSSDRSLPSQSTSLRNIAPEPAPNPAIGTAATSLEKLSCLQITRASFRFQPLSHIVPQISPSLLISTRPPYERVDPFKRTWTGETKTNNVGHLFAKMTGSWTW